MEILQVESALVCTRRVEGLRHASLRVLRDTKTGKRQVAVDEIGARPGNMVFTAMGSAARYACNDATLQTDLTILGIIDNWEE